MYDRDDMLLKVAIMFYENGFTQTKISKELNISRPTIASLLNEAKEIGVVQITISHPNRELYEIQSDLQEFYPDTIIHVAPQVNGIDDPRVAVGNKTANLLGVLLNDHKKIGIGWGSTISEVVNAFDFANLPDISLIPMIGGAGISDVKIHSNHLVFELGNKTNGHVEYLYAPAVADSIQSKESFASNNYVTTVLEQAKEVDLALMGIGNPTSKSNYVKLGYLTEREYDELKDLNIIGDVLTSFFGADGTPIQTSISERMIGLSIEDLRDIKTTVAAVAGLHKVKPVIAALKKNFIDHLIIDENLAKGILEVSIAEEVGAESGNEE